MRTKGASKASKVRTKGFEGFEGEDEGASKAPSHHYFSDFSNKEMQKTKEDSRGVEFRTNSLLSSPLIFRKDEIHTTKKIRRGWNLEHIPFSSLNTKNKRRFEGG